jgi:hypothetical protein
MLATDSKRTAEAATVERMEKVLQPPLLYLLSSWTFLFSSFFPLPSPKTIHLTEGGSSTVGLVPHAAAGGLSVV